MATSLEYCWIEGYHSLKRYPLMATSLEYCWIEGYHSLKRYLLLHLPLLLDLQYKETRKWKILLL
jgi:hypothetical protein